MHTWVFGMSQGQPLCHGLVELYPVYVDLVAAARVVGACEISDLGFRISGLGFGP